MLKTLALENILDLSFFQTKKQSFKVIKKEESQVKYWFSIGLIAVNVLFLMSYIYGVNDFAASGYEIKSIQKQLALLNEDNKKINLKVSEANSMVVIQNDFLSANFVPGGTTKFLQANQFSLK